jgi:non-canonical poly(A) RNA polymerase PAPD5/7
LKVCLANSLTSRRLNNEIADFYDLVEPNEHEKRVRRGLISRIENAIAKSILPGASKVLCFGSFPVDLFLPTADMDLVLATVTHINGGPKSLDFSRPKEKNRVLNTAASRLKTYGIATDTLCIRKAKVPIVKFTDLLTGIKVDISFENLSGIAAQGTFERWKKHMPDLHVIVALIKQFLVMRGFSDVHTGGLGGFSIICLVYFHLCDYNRRNVVKTPNVGTVFIDFLDFYGNRFDLARHRLVMEPPSLVNKVSCSSAELDLLHC